MWLQNRTAVKLFKLSIPQWYLVLLRKAPDLSIRITELSRNTQTPLMRLIYFDAFYDRLHVIPQIAYQLLALGYGRRELHAQLADLPLLDENLKQTREFIHSCSRFFPKECHKLRRLVKYFDAGPLSLEQLSRIAIRRAVGGVFFKRHMRSISKRLPPPLFVYQKQKKCCTF